MENNSYRSKFNSIKNKLETLLSNSTIHAIPNIIRTNNRSVKIIWLVFFLISAGFCLFFIVNSILEYYEYNTNSKTETIFENSTEFPEIILCNLNMFTTEYAFDFIKRISKENEIDIFNQSNDLTNFNLIARSNVKKMAKELQSKMSLPLSEFLVKCSFNYFECDTGNFTEIYDNYYGKCFRMNPITQNFKTGLLYGLNLILNVWFDESLEFFNENIGAIIRINNRTIKYAESELDIPLSPGFETSILLDRKVEKRLKKPYSKCELEADSDDYYDSEFVTILKNNGIKYSLKYCVSLCYQKYLVSNCNCTDIEEISFFENVDTCKSALEVNHMLKVYNKFIDDYYRECLLQCPIECDKNEFIFTQTYSKMFSVRNNLKLLNFFKNKTITPETIRNSLVKLKINYNSFSYTKMTESPAKNVVSLVSDIGGIMGLFLGMSLLSIVEIFEITIEMISIMTKRL
jgi:hypothetical protein